MTILWTAGDSLEVAFQWLKSIEVDESAGRAPRDAMLPQLDGLDHWIPRPFREMLCEAVDANSISIERLELAGSSVKRPWVEDHLSRR